MIPLRNFVFCPTTVRATCYIRRKRPTILIVRWAPNGDTVDTPSGGNISPTVRAVSVPSSATSESNAANISFGQAQFVTDDTFFVTGYEYSEDGRRLGIKACFNRPTAIWELKLDPIGLQLETCSRLGAISTGQSCCCANSHLSDEDIGPQPHLSFSAPHSRLECRALVLP
jgi:hypothetical protein